MIIQYGTAYLQMGTERDGMAGLVTFEDVYKRYRMGEVTITAVDGISFQIEEGEFAVVVGSSGAGKTTTDATQGKSLSAGRTSAHSSKRSLPHTAGTTSALFSSSITLCQT